MCDCIYHSAKEGGKKTEFVNVKVPVTVKIRQYFFPIFLLWTQCYITKNTKRLYWFMLMVSRALLYKCMLFFDKEQCP